MELRDFIVTPIVLFIIYFLAYFIRPRVTDTYTRKYFIPALTVKVIGALAVGFVYQFYYSGGDTFAFHTHGSRVIWEAFMENPINGLKLLIANGEHEGSTYEYSSQIWYFRDQQTYLIIRIAFLLDLITFSTYSATAVLFAVLSFTGIWALYITFYQIDRQMHFWLALAVLFVPSVFFWGSGILKDTLTLGCLGWVTYTFYRSFILIKISFINFVFFIINIFLLYSVKKYIIICFLPALVIWLFVDKFNGLRNSVLKMLIAPFVTISCVLAGYFAIELISAGDAKYSLNNLAKTAQVTAYDIRYGWGARFGDGAGYSLGELDGTFSSVIRLMPSAINVSLFRPYLWEVRNPLMLLSAFEALLALIFTIWVMSKVSIRSILGDAIQSEILFCLGFAIIFAAAVGISTYNFGSLARYKIPLVPFYFSGLIFLYSYTRSKSFKKLEVFD